MPLSKPDPRFTHSKKARRNFRLALKISLVCLGVLWAIFMVDTVFGLRLARFGLRPGSVAGLTGLLSAPLLHGGFQHILSNSLPFFIAMTATLYLYPRSAARVIPLVWVGSGAITWFIGRSPSLHVGASGLIYGLLAFVFFSGVLRRDMRSVAVSLMVGFLYGSMVWGVLPIRPQMSWEMHLSGALIGVLLAFVFRHWDRPPLVRYDWEDDDEVPEWFPETDKEDFDPFRKD
ncbi:MAG: rhomboid family intramembrane serine protease [Xanthomonadales bacterium]|nr:rhomboid family intramembrane serine protease [Gammaproteobacteria bacterium]MBT8052398.1 rhomboid family intramembrane serine protease [Gammaproteobacteria bacterium]NND55717.1 rhomboid family intramembrane serine protease [Xanthomonadales bacterium]NNK52277.1 rhomboid family intramembrane serine protease [Xanthomonadales bacterium]